MLLLLARAMQHFGRASGRRTALLFFDVRAAYYRLVRQLVVPLDESEEAFARLFHSLQIPPHAVLELRQHLEQLAAIPRSGASEHVTKMTADLYRGSWFRLDHASLLAFTRRGSRPGDPVADLIYAFSLAAMTKALDARLRDPDLDAPSEISMASWADDSLRFVAAPSLPALLVKAEETLKLCFESATALGVLFAPGRHKTAVMITDPAAGRCAAVDAVASPPAISFYNEAASEACEIEVVSAYKYLGGILTSNLSSRVETQFRKALACGTARPLVGKLFSNRSFSLRLRRSLLQTLVVSRYTYGGIALHLVSALDRRVWYQGLIALWRLLQKSDRVTRKFPHSFAVLEAAASPFPSLALALSRAKVLQHLSAAGPVTLLQVLQAHWEVAPQRAWLGQLVHDVALVVQFVPAATVVQSAVCPVRALFESFGANPYWWIRIVQKACKVCIQDCGAWVKSRGDCGLTTLPAPSCVPRSAFTCHVCQASFPLRKHLHTHLANVHQLWSPARHFAVGPFCLGCHKWFHSIRRVQSHLKQTPTCLAYAAQVIEPLTQDEVRAVELPAKLIEQGLRRGAWSTHEPVAPALTYVGPLLPTQHDRLRDADDTWNISELCKGHVPRVAVLAWIDAHISGRSVEGSRDTASEFWHRRWRP